MSRPLSKIYGQLANERGKSNERRALEAIRSLTELWIISSRAATAEEDARGIDIVVTTDVGDIYVQVKSSQESIRQSREKYSRRSIATVCAARNETQMRNRVRQCLIEKRAEFLRNRERP